MNAEFWVRAPVQHKWADAREQAAYNCGHYDGFHSAPVCEAVGQRFPKAYSAGYYAGHLAKKETEG